MNLDLHNRVAIVTGATGGIGRAIAKQLYQQGALVVLTARNLDNLHILYDELVSLNLNSPIPMCAAIDLTTPGAAQELTNRTLKFCDSIDILVNNAAILDGRILLRNTPDYLARITHVNYIVPYNLMQATIPTMLKNKYGRIINITSVAGYFGEAGLSAYAGSKGGLAAVTKSVADEYGRRGITANCVAPGVIETDAIDAIPQKRKRELLNTIPARRFGKPQEVADLVGFLASESAAYINGQQLLINGGLIR